MRKNICLLVLLFLVMLVSGKTLNVQAAEPRIGWLEVGDKGIVSDDCEQSNLPEGITYEASTNTLTLTNYQLNYSVASNYIINYNGDPLLNIVLVGDNKLETSGDSNLITADYRSTCEGVRISGTGSLTLVKKDSDGSVDTTNLTIDSAKIYTEGVQLKATNNISVKNATVAIDKIDKRGIFAGGISVENSTVSIKSSDMNGFYGGIGCDGKVSLKNSNVKIATGHAYETESAIISMDAKSKLEFCFHSLDDNSRNSYGTAKFNIPASLNYYVGDSDYKPKYKTSKTVAMAHLIVDSVNSKDGYLPSKKDKDICYIAIEPTVRNLPAYPYYVLSAEVAKTANQGTFTLSYGLGDNTYQSSNGYDKCIQKQGLPIELKLIPKNEYEVQKVLLNGKEVKVTFKYGQPYAIFNMPGKNSTVQVYFQKMPPVPKKNSTATSGNLTYKVTKASKTDGTVALVKPKKKTASVTIPATVKINGYTFKVTTVAAKAFYGDKKIKTIKFGKNITSIGNQAFQGCTSLKTVTLNDALTTIGDSAFRNCKKLTKITIPSNVKQIGKNAFYGDSKLKKITIKSTQLKKVGKGALKNINKKAVIKVPKKKLAAYKKLLKKKGQKASVKIKK